MTQEPTTPDPLHLTREELETGLHAVLDAPRSEGQLDLIVSRPAENERVVLEEARLDELEGLVGDRWQPPRREGEPDLGRQLNLMGTRAIALIAGDHERWPLAGDQLFIDLDLSEENLPAGTRLEVGSALLEVTDKKHAGCKKFAARFGPAALDFVNDERGRSLNLRGICARVLRGGPIRQGDRVKKIA